MSVLRVGGIRNGAVGKSQGLNHCKHNSIYVPQVMYICLMPSSASILLRSIGAGVFRGSPSQLLEKEAGPIAANKVK